MAFRKRDSRKIEIFVSDGTYARVLMVRAGQLVGDDEDEKRGRNTSLFLNEYLEQRIDEDFREIYGMTFAEFSRRNRVARILKKPSLAHGLAAAELQTDDGQLPNDGSDSQRRTDPVHPRG